MIALGIQGAGSAAAQGVAYSKVRGIYTVKVPGTPDPGAPVRTYLGIQLLPNIRFSGEVSSVAGNTITFSGGADLSGIGDPQRISYVHVTEGAGTGFIADIESFNSTGVICKEDVSQRVVAGDRVLIRPHSSLSDLLGVNNAYGLGEGTNADAADNVVIWDSYAQAEKVFYFHSTRARWEESGVEADAGSAVFRFPQGFYMVRRSPGTLRIKISGSVASESILLPLKEGANVFSLPVNLSASLQNLVRTEGSFRVSGGSNAADADLLTFHEPTGSLRRGPFYYFSGNGAHQWREVGVDDGAAASSPLDLLATLVIRKKAGSGQVLVAGSIAPPAVQRVALPPDPEPGEIQLVGELELPRVPPGSSVSFTVESSIDLQDWVTIPHFEQTEGLLRFHLPSGQHRAFYRVKASY